MKSRRKTLNLVMDGIDLYNTAYEDLSPTRTITPTKRSCFRDLVKNIQAYDDVLNKMRKILKFICEIMWVFENQGKQTIFQLILTML